jgi:hypothetical protein
MSPQTSERTESGYEVIVQLAWCMGLQYTGRVDTIGRASRAFNDDVESRSRVSATSLRRHILASINLFGILLYMETSMTVTVELREQPRSAGCCAEVLPVPSVPKLHSSSATISRSWCTQFGYKSWISWAAVLGRCASAIWRQPCRSSSQPSHTI